jgi:hypothetical protein
MTAYNIILYTSIAIIYNIFVHVLAACSYKNLQYEEKQQNITIMLIIFGCIGLIFSKLTNKPKYKNEIVSKGLYYGAILLFITALFANWQYIIEEMKLFLIGGLLCILIWYAYKNDD